VIRPSPLRSPGSRLAVVAALVALPTTGCYHPPQPKVRIAMNALPADVLYGSTASAVLPGGVAIAMPSLRPPSESTAGGTQSEDFAPSGPPAPPSTGTPPEVCPLATSAVVRHPAVNRVIAAPEQATYPFRGTQQLTVDKPGPVVSLDETRQVSAVVPRGNTITFDVTTRYTGTEVVEVTGYQVTTSSDVPSGQEGSVPVGALSGVYITDQSITTTKNGAATTSTVTWSPPLQILKLPASVSQTWAVSSTDQKTGESETFTGKVNALRVVNACGSLVQGYEAQLTGELVTPGQAAPVSFDDTLLIAPQFGALVLADKAVVTVQTSATTTQTQTMTDTINVTPKLPRGSNG
jgi:hypothetical protein